VAAPPIARPDPIEPAAPPPPVQTAPPPPPPVPYLPPPPAPVAAPAPAAPFALPHLINQREQTVFPIVLGDADVGLGRSVDNVIVVDDNAASRYHARVRLNGGRYLLEDLNSANGTYVNSARVGQPVPLNDGDEIRIGETRWVFHEGRLAATTPSSSLHEGTASALH
jgi:hypothetical protein